MDEEFCEVDFTTATAWENFTANLESVFFAWNLCQLPEDTAFDNCESFVCECETWFRKKERLEYEGKEYDVSLYHKQSAHPNQAKSIDRKDYTQNTIAEETVAFESAREYLPLDVNCLSKNLSKYGFAEKLTKLIRLYSLHDFVLLTPVTESSNVFLSENLIKLLMSSFCISAFNTRCYVPIFVQVFNLWQNCFLGLSVSEDGFRTDYQMVHLAKVPAKLQYFPGLLDLLKTKISTSSRENCVWASVKFSYSISDFNYFAWPSPPKIPLTSQEDAAEQETQLSFSLPFGAVCEPISEIHLHVSWPKVYENMVMDNESHSDFKPSLANYWSLKIYAKDTRHLLGQHISQFLQLCQSSTIINDLIGDLLKRRNFSPVDVNVPASLSISKIITGSNTSSGSNSNFNETKRSKRFLSENTMVPMLYYLFPDADEENAHPYPSNTTEDANEDTSLKGMKTCAIDELPWRLSIIICTIIYSYGEHAAAQFWYEFTQELRFRWDKCLRIPGIQKGVPNHKTSLLNQKLQMLNCCIQKRKKRENMETLSEDSDDQNNAAAMKYESEDEEFFDCHSEPKEAKEDGENVHIRRSIWNQPEGRLRKFNNMRLIETGEFMYIPITQEMTPKTEDQLEDDAVVLMKLGSDSQGSELRARMMCASLYSDMEAFKAANPGAVLADFIRWYSPRDWIESLESDKYGQKKGKLSNRMLLPGNMWKEVWDNSVPLPACRQKCLFDDVKESEKVLHFFESHKNVSDVFSLLLPTLIHAGLCVTINDENVNMLRSYSSSVDERINTLIQKTIGTTRNLEVDISQYKMVADEISDIESIVTRYKSLEQKLLPHDLSTVDEEEKKMLIEHVLNGNDIVVADGPNGKLGRRIVYLFAKEAEESTALRAHNPDKSKRAENHFASTTSDMFHLSAASLHGSRRKSEAPEYAITTAPFQKEFILHVNSSIPHLSSRSSSHTLMAHVCSEELFIATGFKRDSVFV